MEVCMDGTPNQNEPMVVLLDRLRTLEYRIRPYGGIFDLITPDGLQILTIPETEYFRDPDGCVSGIRRSLRKAGYPT
jgi:hypothetical protein